MPERCDYLDAIQCPWEAFATRELEGLQVDRTAPGGLPLSWAGANAIVFRGATPARGKVAVRCFTAPLKGLAARYQAYERFRGSLTAQGTLSQGLVGTQFLPQGVKIRGAWHPLLLMPWVEGQPLNVWASRNMGDSLTLRRFQDRFRALMQAMEQAGFVHGDLQHGNLLVTPEGWPRLVDYDGVYPPGAQALEPGSAGLPSFQHPRLEATSPRSCLDRFPALVIDAALEALAVDPSLMQGREGVDGLLFTAKDLRNPATSDLFQALLQHPALRALGEALLAALEGAPEQVPSLEVFQREIRRRQRHPTGIPYRPAALERLSALYDRMRLPLVKGGVALLILGMTVGGFRVWTGRDAVSTPPLVISGPPAPGEPSAVEVERCRRALLSALQHRKEVLVLRAVHLDNRMALGQRELLSERRAVQATLRMLWGLEAQVVTLQRGHPAQELAALKRLEGLPEDLKPLLEVRP